MPLGVKVNLRSTLAYAISHMQGYEAYTRVDLSAIMDEQKFQRTGLVNDSQIKKLGEMTGASYVLVAEAAYYDESHIVVTATIIDVETARIKESSQPEIAPIDPAKMRESCIQIARTLLGKTVNSGNGGGTQRGGSSYAQQGASTLTIRVGNVSFEMIKVEAGSFTMGCTGEQGSECESDESPYHRVTITQAYYIGKFEVTQELYEAVMGVNPSSFKGYDRPVESVSWEDAQEFCAELSRLTGRRFSLPTEAEWEYAARGGNKSSGSKYSGGYSAAAVAWYTDNSGGQTHPVGTKRPNELGIYDMSGNVWEWCQDWYGSYGSSSQTDPTGPYSGSSRVLRGGSWYSNARCCRVANRSYGAPSYRGYYVGFRVVLH